MNGEGLIKVTKNQLGRFVLLILQVILIMCIVYIIDDKSMILKVMVIGVSAPSIIYFSLFLIATYLS